MNGNVSIVTVYCLVWRWTDCSPSIEVSVVNNDGTWQIVLLIAVWANSETLHCSKTQNLSSLYVPVVLRIPFCPLSVVPDTISPDPPCRYVWRTWSRCEMQSDLSGWRNIRLHLWNTECRNMHSELAATNTHCISPLPGKLWSIYKNLQIFNREIKLH